MTKPEIRDVTVDDQTLHVFFTDGTTKEVPINTVLLSGDLETSLRFLVGSIGPLVKAGTIPSYIREAIGMLVAQANLTLARVGGR